MGYKYLKLDKRSVCFIVLLFILSYSIKGQIIINEFSASNSSTIENIKFSEYSDWIELYNQGSDSINLNGYFLTDNYRAPDKWMISDDIYIQAKAYLLIWADGRGDSLNASFKLSAEGEEIALYSPSLNLLDSISFSVQQTDISFGRKTDGAGIWGYFNEPTPDTANTGNFYTGIAYNTPIFSQRGGMYQSSISVELFTDLGGQIRYTTDGSEPDENSSVYLNEISIDSTTILRARVFKPDMVPAPTVTQSYFINENAVQAKLPVVSIATDPDNFWDSEKGIYVQDFKPLWEVPINIELFENNGSDRAAFNELAGTKVNGLWSWQLPQKMLGVYFKKKYGSGSLDYPILHQRKRSSYKSFALRASGSDWSYTLFRDKLGQNATMLNMDIDIMSFRPAVVYVNGEYLGIHNIREKVDDDYIEKSYGIAKGSFDLIENERFAEAGDLSEYNKFLALLSADLSSDVNYNEVTEVIDIENFTDYVITEMATANTSIDHNVMAWKPKGNGKWKWILMDLDRGFFNPTDHLIDYYAARGVLPLKELLTNQGYKEYFAKRLAAHLFTSFHPERMHELIDEHASQIELEIPEHIDRWQGTTSKYGNAMPSVNYWQNQVCALKSFAKERPAALLADLERLGFSSTANLSLACSPMNAGGIKIESLYVPGSSWSAPYLTGVDIQLLAEPKPGYEFIGWYKSSKHVIIAGNSDWQYSDTGDDLGQNWTQPGYNTVDWKSGIAELGYGDGDENTTISYGSDGQNKYITTYFRKEFTLSKEEKESNQFAVNLLKDDGAVVYINGIEVIRANIPCGSINYKTLALSAVTGDSESNYSSYSIDGSLLNEGQNIVAVEVHQSSRTSSDISFNLELVCFMADAQSYVSDNPEYTFKMTDDTQLTAVFNQTSSCIIPENITQDLILDKECSPYMAQDDINIYEGATLTIEPGVEIWMPADASIYVSGRIIAKGTAQSGITIKLNPEYNPESWGIIYFYNTTQKSSLKHLTIEDASQGSDPVLEKAAISAFYADLELDHLTIDSVYGNPISARYSDISLTNSRLHSKITGDLINVKYGKARIENCSFNGNDQPDTDAIDYDEIEDGIIRNCKISNFYGLNSDAVDIGENAKNILIDSISVYNITDKGVSVGQRSTVTIQNSIFINCNKGVALKDSSWAKINRNVFYGNVEAIASYEKNLGSAGGNGLVSNCIISNYSEAPLFVDSKSTLDIYYSLTDDQVNPLNSSNTSGNPLFEAPSFYNFHLLDNSPGIMAGFEFGGPIDAGVYNSSASFEPNVMIYQLFINPDYSELPEFIALYNPSDEQLDLSGYAFTKGITLTIPEGTLLESKDILYLTNDISANSWWQQTKQIIEWESGKLSKNGEALQLEERHGIVVDYLKYEDNGLWMTELFTDNAVMELIDPKLDNHFPESWKMTSVAPIFDTTAPGKLSIFKVYPNPTTGYITVRGLDYENHRVEILNLSGQIIYQSILDERGLARINLGKYRAGIFFIRVGGEVLKVILLDE